MSAQTIIEERLKEIEAREQAVSDPRKRTDTYLASVHNSQCDVPALVAAVRRAMKDLEYSYARHNDGIAAKLMSDIAAILSPTKEKQP